MKEFTFISQLTKKFAVQSDVVLGVNDDAAILRLPSEQLLVASIDTMVEGVHFFSTVAPFHLGHKIMAVSLSDMAAMGAQPRWALLSLAAPKLEQAWLDAFTAGINSILERFSVSLVGGDTTFAQQLVLSSQLLGSVGKKQALTRAGAKPGDKIFVTGYLGMPALALAVAAGKYPANPQQTALLQQALELPMPRVLEGQALLGVAHSAIDISDGLAADLTHILTQSQCAATIYTEKLPLRPEVAALVGRRQAIEFALTGGDDYELCFTVAPEQLTLLAERATHWTCPVTEIGEITSGNLLTVLDDQHQQIQLTHLGYEHFS